MKKLLAATWLLLGAYSVIAAYGGGAARCAALAMVCGFMVARNLADLVEGL